MHLPLGVLLPPRQTRHLITQPQTSHRESKPLNLAPVVTTPRLVTHPPRPHRNRIFTPVNTPTTRAQAHISMLNEAHLTTTCMHYNEGRACMHAHRTRLASLSKSLYTDFDIYPPPLSRAHERLVIAGQRLGGGNSRRNKTPPGYGALRKVERVRSEQIVFTTCGATARSGATRSVLGGEWCGAPLSV